MIFIVHRKNENIIIFGPPGVAKSMIATGIGINACKAGKTVLFINAKKLMDKLLDSLKCRKSLNLRNKHNDKC